MLFAYLFAIFHSFAGCEDALSKVQATLKQVGVLNEIRVLSANSSIENAQIVIVGHHHRVDQKVPSNISVEARALLAQKDRMAEEETLATGKLLKNVLRSGDTLLFEAMYERESLGRDRAVAEYLGDFKLPQEIIVGGWDHAGLHAIEGTLWTVDANEAAPFKAFLSLQRTVHMMKRVFNETNRLDPGFDGRVIVLTGWFHASPWDGIVLPTLQRSKLRYVLLGTPHMRVSDFQEYISSLRGMSQTDLLGFVNNTLVKIKVPSELPAGFQRGFIPKRIDLDAIDHVTKAATSGN